MTESTSEATTETVKPLTRDDLDDFGQKFLDKIIGYAEQAQKDQNVITASKSDDIAAQVVLYREGSEGYEEYLSLIDQAEKILAGIDKANESKVEKPSEDQVKAAEVSLASMKEQGKFGINFLEGVYGEGVRALMPESLKGRKSSASAGDTKRPRMQAILVTDSNGQELVNLHDTDKEAKAEDKPTFSALAKWLSNDSGVTVETKDLQNAAFEAAGTKDLSTKTKVEFGKTLGEKHYGIVAVSKVK